MELAVAVDAVVRDAMGAVVPLAQRKKHLRIKHKHKIKEGYLFFIKWRYPFFN